MNGDPMRARLQSDKSAESEKSVTTSQIFSCRARFLERKRNLQKNWRKTNYICGILGENKLTSYHLPFSFPKRFLKKF